MAVLAAPVPPNERIVTLDVIRGFALLGIFIMNMPYFNTSLLHWFAVHGIQVPLSRRWLRRLQRGSDS
jgi:uncharacterized protein